MDLDTIRDINDRHGLEVQIMEFGQIPKQIFTLPHPKRSVLMLDKVYAETVSTSLKSGTGMVHYCSYFQIRFQR